MNQIIFYIGIIVYFIFASLLSFYIPGRIILGKMKNLSFFQTTIISFVLGIVFFGWQGYVFGYLNIRYLTYAYLAFFFGFYFIKKYYRELVHIKTISLDWRLLSVVILGVIGQTIEYWSMGWKSADGISISSYDTIDQVWHVSLTNELIQRVPPEEPSQYGIMLHNYHYWFNLVTAEMIRIFHLPILQTQFIGMYVLGSLLLGGSVYLVAKQIYDNKIHIFFCLFFIYFAADATYWFTLLTQRKLNFNVASIIDVGSIYFDSPPRGYAMIISFIALFLLIHFAKAKSIRLGIILGIVFGTIIGFKVYSGIGFLAGLCLLTLYYFFKREWSYIGISLLAVTAAAIVFLPTNGSSGGLLWLPMEVPRDFFTQSQLGLQDWPARWLIYKDHNNYLRLVQYGLMMGGLYLVLQLGIRIFGFYPIRKTKEVLGTPLLIFLYGVIFSCIALMFFFYQKVGGQNINWFLLVASNMLLLLLSLNISFLIQKWKQLSSVIIIFVILVTIPRWAYNMANVIPGEYFSGFHGITNSELEAYDFLKTKTDSSGLLLVLSASASQDIGSLVPIFTSHNTYYSGVGSIGQRDVVEIKQRTQMESDLKSKQDKVTITKLLKNKNIKYIVYENGEKDAAENLKIINAPIIFHNEFATIVEVPIL